MSSIKTFKAIRIVAMALIIPIIGLYGTAVGVDKKQEIKLEAANKKVSRNPNAEIKKTVKDKKESLHKIEENESELKEVLNNPEQQSEQNTKKVSMQQVFEEKPNPGVVKEQQIISPDSSTKPEVNIIPQQPILENQQIQTEITFDQALKIVSGYVGLPSETLIIFPSEKNGYEYEFELRQHSPSDTDITHFVGIYFVSKLDGSIREQTY